MGLWRLVTAALGNGSCGFKWHRLNFLQPWRAEALSAGLPRGCAPLKAPGEGVSSFFWLVEAAPIPWLVAPSSIFKSSTVASSDLTLPSLCPLKGLTWLYGTHPDNPEYVTISKCFIAYAKPLLPRKVIYSQLSGIRIWTFWGVHYSACHRRPINNFPKTNKGTLASSRIAWDMWVCSSEADSEQWSHPPPIYTHCALLNFPAAF